MTWREDMFLEVLLSQVDPGSAAGPLERACGVVDLGLGLLGKQALEGRVVGD